MDILDVFEHEKFGLNEIVLTADAKVRYGKEYLVECFKGYTVLINSIKNVKYFIKSFEDRMMGINQ